MNPIADALGLYRPLIDDWEAFAAASDRRLLSALFVNRPRIAPDELRERLAARGIELQPLPWCDGAFRVDDATQAGKLPEYAIGLYHLHDAISLLPSLLLAPRPGDRVLDLCAAPGVKTLHLAIALANRGTVVANDLHYGRLRSIRDHLNRLGIANVSVTCHDGRNYPNGAGSFDRILADVPCSCLGTSRKSAAAKRWTGPDASLSLQPGQIRLLRRAVELCAPGGRIVYSTCTYAPEECEAVVDAVLKLFGHDRLRLLSAHLPGLRTTPGLTAWQESGYDSSLALAARVWPHHNDTGGFFVALLEKTAGDAPAVPPLPMTDCPERDAWLALLQQRYAFPERLFDRYVITRPGNKNLALTAADHRPPAVPPLDSTGFPFMHVRGRYPKLTTTAAQLLGHVATRNAVDLVASQVPAYLTYQPVTLLPGQSEPCDIPGFVIVRFDGLSLGTAIIHHGDAGPWLESQFPHDRRYEGADMTLAELRRSPPLALPPAPG